MAKRWVMVLLAILAGIDIAAAAGFSSLEERMSQADFHAAGLDKLSPDELAKLNDWLRSHGSSGEATVAGSSAHPVFYPDESARETVEAHIVGRFAGWHGKTQFTLDNGQVWQQAESGSGGDVSLDGPAVRIKPMMLGSWLMNVEGCGCSVRVKRVK